MTAAATVLEVALPTGQTVRGQRWGSGADTVLLIHGPGDDLDAWEDFPAYLAGSGQTTVAIDLPGHGLSDDPWQPAGVVEAVQAVAAHLRERGAARFFLVAAGESVLSTLRVAVACRAAALVALSPPTIAAEREVADLRVTTLPKLLLVGAGEEDALTTARRVFGRCAGWTLLSNLPTSEQGTSLLAGSWGGQAREQIAAFLRDYRVVEPSSDAGRHGGLPLRI